MTAKWDSGSLPGLGGQGGRLCVGPATAASSAIERPLFFVALVPNCFISG